MLSNGLKSRPTLTSAKERSPLQAAGIDLCVWELRQWKQTKLCSLGAPVCTRSACPGHTSEMRQDTSLALRLQLVFADL